MKLSKNCFDFAEICYRMDALDRLEASHTPRDADTSDLEIFEISTFEWALAVEAALRARRSSSNPKDHLLRWNNDLPCFGEKALLQRLGLD